MMKILFIVYYLLWMMTIDDEHIHIIDMRRGKLIPYIKIELCNNLFVSGICRVPNSC